MWFLKCKMRQTKIFVILGQFLPFQPPGNPENQNFKIEEITWRYYHFTHLHHTWQSYDVCFLGYGMWRTEFFLILDRFLPFHLHPSPTPSPHPHPKQPKKSKFWKNEKIGWRYYHFIQVYHRLQLYDVWFLRYGACRTKCLAFWTILCPFIPLKTWKIKIFKNWKKTPGDIIILQWCTKNLHHVLYCSWYMAHNRCNYFSFWAIFCFASQERENLKFKKIENKKKKRKVWRYHHFAMVYQKSWSYAILFLRFCA